MSQNTIPPIIGHSDESPDSPASEWMVNREPHLDRKRSLSFSTSTPPSNSVDGVLNGQSYGSDMDDSKGLQKKTTRDPLSHRIIEKRRRDRMNNCLADLSRLIPAAYIKKGRGRIEKTEIIEMAIKHLRHLQSHGQSHCEDPKSCEVNTMNDEERKQHFNHGYKECVSEVMRFMVEYENMIPADGFCQRMITHLDDHYDMMSSENNYDEGRMRSASVSSAASGNSVSTLNQTNGSSDQMDVNEIEIIEPSDSSSNQINELSAGSQLRDLLQSAPGVRQSSPYAQTMIVPSTPSNLDLSANRSVTFSPNSNEAFRSLKKEFKERFQAGLKHSNNGNIPSGSPKEPSLQHQTLRQDDYSNGFHDKKPLIMRRTKSDFNSLSPENNSSSSSSGYRSSDEGKPHVMVNKEHQKGLNNQLTSRTSPLFVPGFALHPSGAYYFPILLDQFKLSEYLFNNNFDESSPVLHPVNIAVNFNMPPTRPVELLNNNSPIDTHLRPKESKLDFTTLRRTPSPISKRIKQHVHKPINYANISPLSSHPTAIRNNIHDHRLNYSLGFKKC